MKYHTARSFIGKRIQSTKRLRRDKGGWQDLNDSHEFRLKSAPPPPPPLHSLTLISHELSLPFKPQDFLVRCLHIWVPSLGGRSPTIAVFPLSAASATHTFIQDVPSQSTPPPTPPPPRPGQLPCTLVLLPCTPLPAFPLPPNPQSAAPCLSCGAQLSKPGCLSTYTRQFDCPSPCMVYVPWVCQLTGTFHYPLSFLNTSCVASTDQEWGHRGPQERY